MRQLWNTLSHCISDPSGTNAQIDKGHVSLALVGDIASLAKARRIGCRIELWAVGMRLLRLATKAVVARSGFILSLAVVLRVAFQSRPRPHQEGWMICSLCHKMLAGYCTVLSHFESRNHRANLTWSKVWVRLRGLLRTCTTGGRPRKSRMPEVVSFGSWAGKGSDLSETSCLLRGFSRRSRL